MMVFELDESDFLKSTCAQVILMLKNRLVEIVMREDQRVSSYDMGRFYWRTLSVCFLRIAYLPVHLHPSTTHSSSSSIISRLLLPITNSFHEIPWYLQTDGTLLDLGQLYKNVLVCYVLFEFIAIGWLVFRYRSGAHRSHLTRSVHIGDDWRRASLFGLAPRTLCYRHLIISQQGVTHGTWSRPEFAQDVEPRMNCAIFISATIDRVRGHMGNTGTWSFGSWPCSRMIFLYMSHFRLSYSVCTSWDHLILTN